MQDIAPVNWLRIGFLGVVWGASFMFMTLALGSVGPLLLAAMRIALGAVFLVGLAHAMGIGLPPRRGPDAGRIWLFALAMALFSNAVPFTLLGWGQQVVASGFAGVCMSAVPLLILPLAHIFVPGEHLTWRRLAGFVLGTGGVVVLIGPDAFASTGKDFELLAKLACVAAAGCYATGTIFTRLCPDVDRVSLSAAVLLLASVILLPVALIVEGLPEDLDMIGVIAVVYLGILPTGVAQIVLVQVNREAGPSFFGLVNYMVPVWSVIFGALILSEPVPPSLLSGLALILFGVALSQAAALRRLFGHRATG